MGRDNHKGKGTIGRNRKRDASCVMRIAYNAHQTGGGIVADSDPEAEWDETITKARALLAGIESVMRRA
jgi:para-aminobenzoate synthetase component 1